MRLAPIVLIVLILVQACAHRSANNALTTPEVQERMLRAALGVERDAPPEWRRSARHGPMACHRRWQYESEEKFETCVRNWLGDERTRPPGPSNAAKAAAIIATALVVLGASTGGGHGGLHMMCTDATLDASCGPGSDPARCCALHGGVAFDANGVPVLR